MRNRLCLFVGLFVCLGLLLLFVVLLGISSILLDTRLVGFLDSFPLLCSMRLSCFLECFVLLVVFSRSLLFRACFLFRQSRCIGRDWSKIGEEHLHYNVEAKK